AQYCAPPVASIPTTQRGSSRMNPSICARRSCRRITTRPLPSAALTANALFAKSIPIVVTSISDPCISTTASQDRLRRGRSTDPGLPEGQSGGEQESPRRNHRRSQVRTVAGTGVAPGRIAQGGIRSAKRDEEQMGKPGVWVGVDVSKDQLEVALRPSGAQFSL